MRIKGRSKSVNKGLKCIFAAIAQRDLLLVAIALRQRLADFHQVLVIEFHSQHLRLKAPIPEIILGRRISGPGNALAFDADNLVGIKVQAFKA